MTRAPSARGTSAPCLRWPQEGWFPFPSEQRGDSLHVPHVLMQGLWGCYTCGAHTGRGPAGSLDHPGPACPVEGKVSALVQPALTPDPFWSSPPLPQTLEPASRRLMTPPHLPHTDFCGSSWAVWAFSPWRVRSVPVSTGEDGSCSSLPRCGPWGTGVLPRESPQSPSHTCDAPSA